MSLVENFSGRMRALYAAMDEAYDAVAKHYGFGCEGCEDNCCTQRFHHHTLAEYHYLLEGMKAAEPEPASRILVKAKIVLDSYRKEIEVGEVLPLMCPVNFDGLCGLYGHRPMICRMHGLPHRFRRPDGREERGGGCARFEEKNATDWTVDRTKEYAELAKIEGEIRKRTLRGGRYRKTTAEMLMDMWAEETYLRELMGAAESP
jgi:Fe-S-cluster containining protein